MLKRKAIVDRNFQLKTTFRIIGIFIIAFILIIAVTGIVSTHNNRAITGAIDELNRHIERDKKTADLLASAAKNKRDAVLAPERERLLGDHLESIAMMQESVTRLNKILERNRLLFTLMIVTGVLLGVFLFIYLIRLTGRMSGPILLLSRHMDDVMNGKDPDLHELRRNDEFKDFYRQFIAFLGSLQKKR